MSIPIIDLFAGPGGLSEGFSSIFEEGKFFFDVKLSIEKDPIAHKTLEFRALYRELLKSGKSRTEYYNVLREPDLAERDRKRVELINSCKEGKKAKDHARLIELGSKTREETDLLIKKALGKNHRKEWLLIGGPPCQAYSLAGRSRVGGIREDDHRVYLYQEYLRIIAEHQPAVFVMENVKGLLSASLNGERIFHRIINDLSKPGKVFEKTKSPDYNIYSLSNEEVNSDNDFLIKAEEYGIPQKRHRVILLGVRSDLRTKPGVLQPVKKQVSLYSVIGQLPAVRSAISKALASDSVSLNKRVYLKVKDSEEQWIKVLARFQKEIISFNGFSKHDFDKNFSSMKRGSEFIPYGPALEKKHSLYGWYIDPKLNGVINHESRAHLLQDIKRYFFCSVYAKKYNKFPRLEDLAAHSADLIPDHKNARSGKFNDRFRVQLANQPASTITSHISKDGHSFIHYDPFQARSLTVREAARIQTFPDNYLFCGSRTQQFHQVGNAVPPYLAKQIAEVVLRIFASY